MQDYRRRSGETRKKRERYQTDLAFREKVKASVRKSGRKRRNDRRIRSDNLVALIIRQGATCGLCDRRLPEKAEEIHIDHVVTLAKGGSHNRENLRAVCAVCNLTRTKS